MELRAKLAQVDSELGALTGRATSIEVAAMSQAEAAARVLQRHEAAGQARQGHLIELRDAAVASSEAIQQLINEARSQTEKARAQQAEL
eukprot:15141395-Alexandrium_andersonii.AAC.1